MDWNNIKAEYIKGGTSYRKLCDKYGVLLSTLKRVAKKEGWVELREQCKSKTTTKIIEIESDRQADRMKRLLDVSDKLLDAVEDAVDKFQAGDLILDKTALKSLSGTIKDIKEIQNIKTQLDIEEQKARIANLKRQSNEGYENDKPSGVVLIPSIMEAPIPPDMEVEEDE